MGAWELVLLGLFVLLGAASQRLTGMGFALIASPLVVLVLGARIGVQLILVLGTAASLLVLVQVWRDVQLGKAVGLFLAGLVGLVPGAWVARTLPAAQLSIFIGGLVIVALLATVLSERARVFKGVPGLVAAGVLSGFMTVTAAVGGPPIVLYSLSTNWEHKHFVATAQLYFAAFSLASLGASGWPALSASAWVVAAVALVAGLALGQLVTKRVSHRAARIFVLVVAFAGAAATIVRGLTQLR